MYRLMESVLDHPEPDVAVPDLDVEVDLDVIRVLHALSDPIRLQIVAQLADGGEHGCNSFELPIVKSTRSHHFAVLREAGVISTRVEGKCRLNRLRSDELEERFPGLLDAVLRARGT